MSTTTTSGRFAFIDALRGIAAMAVVVFHVVGYGIINRPDADDRVPGLIEAIVMRGHLGVEVFFAISGFVIAYTIRHARVTPSFFGRFVLRRTIRLDPPLWTTIAFVIGTNAVLMRVLSDPSVTLPTGGAILAHLVYAQGLLGITDISMGLWTLCIEFQFYVGLVLATAVIQRLPMPRWVAITLVLGPVALASLILFQHGHPSNLFLDHFRFILPNFWMFFVGSTAWWALSGVVPHWYFAATLAAGFVRIGVDLPEELVASAVAATVMYWLGRRGQLATALRAPAWQFFGRLSYSLYLIHFPIAWPFYRAGYRLLGESFTSGVVLVGPAILVSIAGAWMLHRLVEAPSQRFSHRVRLTPPVAA